MKTSEWLLSIRETSQEAKRVSTRWHSEWAVRNESTKFDFVKWIHKEKAVRKMVRTKMVSNLEFQKNVKVQGVKNRGEGI